MWKIIAKKELISVLRNKTFLLLAVIFYVLLAGAAFSGYKDYQAGKNNRKEAKQLFRKEWVEQQANPHSAAHFGTYLFKPFTFLSLFDTGLSAYTGISYRVEAHKQGEINYAAALDGNTEMRFGALTMAILLQLFMPLLIIFLCYNAISREREEHTGKLLLSQGLSPVSLLWGKVSGNYFIVLLLVVPPLALMLVSVAINEKIMLIHAMLFSAIYLVYFFIITALVIYGSAMQSSQSALIFSLGLWVLFCIMLPKLSVFFADRAYPLPSRAGFNRLIEKANTNGLAGDKDRMERYNDYLAQTLKKYKADSVQQLPFNFDGLSMQYSEDYFSKVYRLFAGKLDAKINAQQRFQQIFGYVNPFIAVQQVSMGLAGTDYYQHADFHKSAQSYRDEFIRKLNIKMAYGDKAYLKYDYTVGPDFFRSMKDFEYPIPSAGWVIQKYIVSFTALLLWLVFTLLLIKPVSKKIAIL